MENEEKKRKPPPLMDSFKKIAENGLTMYMMAEQSLYEAKDLVQERAYRGVRDFAKKHNLGPVIETVSKVIKGAQKAQVEINREKPKHL